MLCPYPSRANQVAPKIHVSCSKGGCPPLPINNQNTILTSRLSNYNFQISSWIHSLDYAAKERIKTAGQPTPQIIIYIYTYPLCCNMILGFVPYFLLSLMQHPMQIIPPAFLYWRWQPYAWCSAGHWPTWKNTHTHCRDGIGQVMSVAWFPPDMSRGVSRERHWPPLKSKWPPLVSHLPCNWLLADSLDHMHEYWPIK